MAQRELIRVPDWVMIQDVEGQVGQGEEYWYLQKVEYKPKEISGGLHHIYVEQPHNPAAYMLARNEQQSFRIALDKPAKEPGGNCPMGGGLHYQVQLEGHASDSVSGMHMPSNHHVTYHLWYELRRKEPGPPSSDTKALYAKLRQDAPSRRVLSLNPNASIERRLVQDGFLPTSSEFGVTVAGNAYTAQVADSPRTGVRSRVYYAPNQNFADVRFIEL